MGTHSCLCIRSSDGQVHRIERTLDGQLLVDYFKFWIKSGYPEIVDLHFVADQIGNGETLLDHDGENEQEFSLCLDFQNHKFWASFMGCSRTWYNIVSELLRDGWDFDSLEEHDPPMIEVLELVHKF